MVKVRGARGDSEKFSDDVKGVKVSPEYKRTIKKIASYSGVVRTMQMGDDGKFKEIINIYVYPDGIVANYPDEVADRYSDENSISKQAVRNHGHKNLAIWGKNDVYDATGSAVSRHKKSSHPVKRKKIIKKHH